MQRDFSFLSKILTAEIDLEMIDGERMTLDVSRHYHRPDVCKLQRQPKLAVRRAIARDRQISGWNAAKIAPRVTEFGEDL